MSEYLCIDGPRQGMWVNRDSPHFEVAVHVGQHLGFCRPANVKADSFERIFYYRHRFIVPRRLLIDLVRDHKFSTYDIFDVRRWLLPFGLTRRWTMRFYFGGHAYSVSEQTPDATPPQECKIDRVFWDMSVDSQKLPKGWTWPDRLEELTKIKQTPMTVEDIGMTLLTVQARYDCFMRG